MEGLDEKLADLLHAVRLNTMPRSVAEDVKTIRLMFKSEGWLDPADVRKYYGGLLSGKQWYDKFWKELDAIGAKDKVRSLNATMVKMAAEKASGLS